MLSWVGMPKAHFQKNSGHSHRAHLRVTERFLPWAALLPPARRIIMVALIVALGLAGYEYFFHPFGADALQFTRRTLDKVGNTFGVRGIATGDLNGDGQIDIVTAASSGIGILSHGGKHIFTKKSIDDPSADYVALGDFNNDDKLDIVAGVKDSPGIRWYRNNGDFSFTGFSLAGTGVTAGKIAVADLDRDGSDDIVAATKEGEAIVLRRNMGTGESSFNAVTLSGDSKVSAVAVGDVNDNGYPDIITGGENGLQRWDTGDGLTWSRVDIDDQNKNSRTSIAVSDVNRDGKFDIVVGDQSANVVALYRNIDNSVFERIQFDGDADVGTLVPTDLDGDGHEDVVVTSQDDNSVFWFKNDGETSFSKKTLATGLKSVFGLSVIDLDQDKDLDFVTGDYWDGTVYWFEQTASTPNVTAPTNIQQSINSSGLVTFETVVTSFGFTRTRLRVEYSIDGKNWYKPYLTEVTPSAGSVDLKYTNGYQIGTTNPIDTDINDNVGLTITWDTKSTLNGGGPIVGDVSSVQLRLTVRDDKVVGDTVTSSKFRIDHRAPSIYGFNIASITQTDAILVWPKVIDSSSYSFVIYYGTDPESVANRSEPAQIWDTQDDKSMGDVESTGTKITSLTANQTYTFKLFVKDKFGNESSSAAIAGLTDGSGAAAPVSPTPTTGPGASPNPSAGPTAKPTLPPTNFQNKPPTGDAGLDQVVNPSALVILDGTASADPDGDPLIYSWRQLSGPTAELLSARTATPSFSADGENETYIFVLTVRDPKGASATDIVTVAVKQLPKGDSVPVAVDNKGNQPTGEIDTTPVLAKALRPVDLFLFFLSLLAASVTVADRLTRNIQQGGSSLSANESQAAPKGKIVHYRSGEPIAGAQVLVYGTDGKLKLSQRTNARGEFSTLFPVGQYTIGVQMNGFAFAPSAPTVLKPESGILYTGGAITVRDGTRPLNIVIAMKPTGPEVGEWRIRFLHAWQSIQRWSRTLSWPIFLIGALLNTFLIFWVPTLVYLVVEVLYVGLVILKVALEVRVRPAYGLVRDAITHVPLDLAVVRLFEEGTNRLIMTRVTNAQGKFFALPPAGKYTVTVTKPGYAMFSKQNVVISADQDSVLQITTDLMPVTPMGGLSTARAATL